ncbi:MAG TPA: putative metal-dependent hydrolase [Mucilaginibacter sp.]|nr:putative metal-dependent hydrolase [Mucilaginibacter sp.]
MAEDELKYPIGKFKPPASYTAEDIQKWTKTIKDFPGKLRHKIITLNEKQLDTPYRPGGWTIRQVVHHCADSHMNAMLRFKWALTETNPTIKPYHEADWALLSDYRMPVEPSLRILEGLHLRWAAMLESFTENEWNRSFIHPASGDTMQLKKALGMYAWHSKHHLAHIDNALKNI